jgi:hypothetical protein
MNIHVVVIPSGVSREESAVAGSIYGVSGKQIPPFGRNDKCNGTE